MTKLITDSVRPNKAVIILIVLCLTFTGWWAWELDSGPFIFRHAVPDKLENQIASTFAAYFNGRNISSIRFGKKNSYASEKVPVIIVSDNDQKWLIPAIGVGPVYITVEKNTNKISIYWKIPEEMMYKEANEILTETLWSILVQYDNIISVQNTFNE